jgi:hypothetical protein
MYSQAQHHSASVARFALTVPMLQGAEIHTGLGGSRI